MRLLFPCCALENSYNPGLPDFASERRVLSVERFIGVWRVTAPSEPVKRSTDATLQA